MRKRIFAAIAAISISCAGFAWDFPGFEWSVGADITSAYLWRGLNLGGLAIQPDVSIGYGGLKLETWANISPKDYKFKEIAPELDLTLSYSIVGLTVGVNHQYYFDKTKFFDWRMPTLEQYNNGDYAGNQTEVFAEFNLGDILEDVPFHIGWYTYVAGDDYAEQYAEDGETVIGIKRAYSSYFDVSYDFGLPLGFSITPTVGMSPWKGMYNYYDEGFSVNNISLKLNWEFEGGDHFALDVYAIGAVNTAGINKENVWRNFYNTSTGDWNTQRLHFAIGLGVWFF